MTWQTVMGPSKRKQGFSSKTPWKEDRGSRWDSTTIDLFNWWNEQVQKTHGDHKTFGEVSEQVIMSALNVAGSSRRVDVVFDVYKEISIKNAERVNRGSGVLFTCMDTEFNNGENCWHALPARHLWSYSCTQTGRHQHLGTNLVIRKSMSPVRSHVLIFPALVAKKCLIYKAHRKKQIHAYFFMPTCLKQLQIGCHNCRRHRCIHLGSGI
jgi:hypothetical protein